MIARRILAAAAALIVGIQVVRNAAVDALAEREPDAAASVWAGHPATELSLAMTRIAVASRDRVPIADANFRMMQDAARKAPLEAQPYLVRGVQNQLAGNATGAEQAFAAAQHRNPRSLPAAYFLATHYFQANDPDRALEQLANLTRLAPNGVASLAPYLAAYARNRSNWPRIRVMLRSESQLQDAALLALASSPANADAILALADEQHRSPRATWLPKLLGTLIEAGQYRRAKAIWAQVGGVPNRPDILLQDATFSSAYAPPPFNWELGSSSVGLAERQPGGRLHVIFYGQDDGVLARQLLVLAPGSYRMKLHAAGDPAGAHALNWVVRCDKAPRELARARVDLVAAVGWTFSVPSGCGAQWLELNGASSDMPRQADVTISDLNLSRGARGG